MLSLLLGALLLSVGITSVTIVEEFNCKPRAGCKITGCLPTALSDGSQQKEILITCQPGNPLTGSEQLPTSTVSTRFSAPQENLTQKVQDMEKSHDELVETTSKLENKIKQMDKDIIDMKLLLNEMAQKNKEMVEARAWDRERLFRLEEELKIRRSNRPFTNVPPPRMVSSFEYSTTATSTIPTVYNWGEWEKSQCSATCGGGMISFSRSCLNSRGEIFSPDYCSGGFGDNYAESEECNTEPCTMNYNEWASWTKSPCSATCGLGTQIDRRDCLDKKWIPVVVSVDLCQGQSSREVNCMKGICPSGTTASSPLSTMTSSQWRVRATSRFRLPKTTPDPETTASTATRTVTSRSRRRTTTQYTRPTTMPGFRWGEWIRSACSATCGGGTSTFSRSCLNQFGYPTSMSNCAGGFGNSTARSVACNTKPCTVDYHAWESWSTSPCSTTCGLGTQTRRRKCLDNEFTPVVVSANFCRGRSSEEVNCMMTICPARPTTSSSTSTMTPRRGSVKPTSQYPLATTTPDHGFRWGEWKLSDCSATCGGGTATFTRSCLNSFGFPISMSYCPGGIRGSTARSAACNTRPCTVNYHAWESWSTSPCSKTCGLGTQIRRRKCFDNRHTPVVVSSDLCRGPSSEEVKCMMTECIARTTAASSTSPPISGAPTQSNMINEILELLQQTIRRNHFQCNFETVNDTCGLTNDRNNDVDWTQSFDRLYSGGREDAEENNGYIRVNLSSAMPGQITSIIKTPKLRPTRRRCVSYRFFMSWRKTAVLKVKARLYSNTDVDMVTLRTISTANTVNTDMWIEHELLYEPQQDTIYVEIEFEATYTVVANAPKSTIAIDDIVINSNCSALQGE